MAAMVSLVLYSLACSLLSHPAPTSLSTATAFIPSPETKIEQLVTITNFDQGLTSLQSFRAQTNLGVTYHNGGLDTRIDVLHEINNPLHEEHFRIIGSGALPPELQFGSFEYYQLPGAFYLLRNPVGKTNSDCTAFGSGIYNLPMIPSISLGLVLGPLTDIPLAAAGEMVGSISTNHYTFTEANLEVGQFTKANGDIWLAQNGGYVVKSTGKAVGNASFLGIDQQANLTWDYELDEINQLSPITPPATCLATATP